LSEFDKAAGGETIDDLFGFLTTKPNAVVCDPREDHAGGSDKAEKD
jgi:hypothetical protein